VQHDPIFTSWSPQAAALFNHQPIRLAHRLHKAAIFSTDGLADLISRYPREHYSLIHMGSQGEGKKFWREGDIGALGGHQVLEAIGRGRMWLNLRDVNVVDREFSRVLDETFAELRERLGGFTPLHRSAGILISSPSAQVYYHADLPGQHLWQLAGKKRVRIYPASAPFITSEQLEDISLHSVEVNMPYQAWYDEHAQVFDLEPGQMLSWPLNAPHRVENLNTLNVSMTVSFVTGEIRRQQMLHLANGILRHRFGFSGLGHATEGPSFWAKAMLQKTMRRTKWARQKKTQSRQINFRLDDRDLGAIVELKAA